eukprot:TRINITY_DN416_c0_g1_i1.p2 TRINITY_DN416_c0_g1~~TRINITY_DN416_c0_g1_i1.p2  ORF type:complete len:337 (+),score=32.47 TRINITY_DN416_c0_g1_i1:88-1098(+)
MINIGTMLVYILAVCLSLSALQLPPTIEDDCLLRLQNYEKRLRKVFQPTALAPTNLPALWDNLNQLKIEENKAKLKNVFKFGIPKGGIPLETNGTFFGFVHLSACLKTDLSQCNGLKGSELIECLAGQKRGIGYMKGWGKLAEAIMTHLDGVQTAVDFGSGKGNTLNALYENGLKLGVGIEPSYYGDLCYYQNGWDNTQKLPIQSDNAIGTVGGDGKFENLMCYLNGKKTMKFDVVMTYEVFEHIPIQEHCSLVNFLAKMVKRWVVTTIAPPGQGGINHIALREKQDWINEWEKRGLTFRQDLTEQFSQVTDFFVIRDNIVVLEALGPVKQVDCKL